MMHIADLHVTFSPFSFSSAEKLEDPSFVLFSSIREQNCLIIVEIIKSEAKQEGRDHLFVPMRHSCFKNPKLKGPLQIVLFQCRENIFSQWSPT